MADFIIWIGIGLLVVAVLVLLLVIKWIGVK